VFPLDAGLLRDVRPLGLFQSVRQGGLNITLTNASRPLIARIPSPHPCVENPREAIKLA
jgi:hypothetical protein